MSASDLPVAPAALLASSTVHLNVTVDGARGNREIQAMVAQGVSVGLAAYDKARGVMFLPGDVGLVDVAGVEFGAHAATRMLFGAVRTPGARWAVKASDGLSAAPFRPVAAWRLPQEAEGNHLVAFLRGALDRPFVFGDCDCAMTVANWVREAAGSDPGADLRGRYRTRLGWMRIVKREGGMEAMFSARLDAAGLTRIL